jgi:hypothetical protein
MSTSLPPAEVFKRVGWLPASLQEHEQWLNELNGSIDHHAKALASPSHANDLQVPELHPDVQELKRLIDSDPKVHSELNRILESMARPVCFFSN